MAYKAAIIGCHGVGKTTLVKKLSDKFKIFGEVSLNSFMGHDNFLSEIKIIVDNILLNKKIKETKADSISDRFAFLDAIIYSEGFYQMGWITVNQLKTIYSIINNSLYEWIYPEKIVIMNDSKQLIMKNILKRGRNNKLNEADDKFLTIMLQLFNDFYTGHLNFQFLNPEIKEKLNQIPKYEIKCYEDLRYVVDILNK
ncbi:MAG: deoxynucleoside kinase [Candidatus Nanoarchaeia archaeon]|nr:deoxynucleoside kinase [Candidatus Nanoarchaeia archaeon]MDD5054147.1 deoxynucleoside kinase [Candidatus Nanoarchaeia archaeon]MDD5499252.1 deoxynucleoside kinase [Candidatus Nanoarchaeia archaeon]